MITSEVNVFIVPNDNTKFQHEYYCPPDDKNDVFHPAKDNTIIDITVIIQLTDTPNLNMNIIIKLDYNMMLISGWIIKLLSTFGLSSAG
jgi:hypothetical protein